jgi:hypothetical protein
MKIDWTWLLIGLGVGVFVVPRLPFTIPGVK